MATWLHLENTSFAPRKPLHSNIVPSGSPPTLPSLWWLDFNLDQQRDRAASPQRGTH
jgi:hypothetical protein